VLSQKREGEKKVNSIIVWQLREARMTVLRKALSNAELRRDQLVDPCLGSVNWLKQKNPDHSPREEVGLKSPTFKSY